MDRARGESAHPPAIIIPRRSLLVLCGPAGSGKSTFAKRLIDKHRHEDFQPTMIVSSDRCRALICDDEASQQVNRDTFDLFYYIIHKRMFQNRFTIADSTALQADWRRRLIDIAQRHRYPAYLLIFNVSLETCLQRDRRRKRMVGEQVITYHIGLLNQALLDTPNEGWDRVFILNEQGAEVGIVIK